MHVHVCARSVQGPLAAVRGEWHFLTSLLVHSVQGSGKGRWLPPCFTCGGHIGAMSPSDSFPRHRRTGWWLLLVDWWSYMGGGKV